MEAGVSCGGVEYRAGARVGVRLDFRRLDNQMSHLLVGVPVPVLMLAP